MLISLDNILLVLVVLTTSPLAVQRAWPQEYTHRLHSPALARGFVGGESHDTYVIRARKEQRMTVQISWRHEHDHDVGNNRAEFFVSELRTFNGDGAVKFGRASDNQERWTGNIPKTGDYYIYVTAHPTAHYTLRVSLE